MNVRTKSPQKKVILLNLTEEEINRRIDQIEALPVENDFREFLADALLALVELDRIIGLKNTTIARLRKIFNKETEKRPKTENSSSKGEKKGRGNNQGRHGQKDYPLAKRCRHCHTKLKEGDLCPECGKGTLSAYKPGIYVRITGNAPLQAVVNETEKFRCTACQTIFEADFEGKDAPKYDAKAKALIAVLKFEASFPYYRLEKIQKQLLTPMPASTQFDLMEELANTISPIWYLFLKLAPEGSLFKIDDTKAKIKSLIWENKHPAQDKKIRKGIYTTGIISTIGDHKIILYFTGRRYAGENLDNLLGNRKSPDTPIVVSDASRTNAVDKDKKTVSSLCLAHSRRKFVDIQKAYQEECEMVLNWFSDLYRNEHHCIENNYSTIKRLEYHQQFSAPIMDSMKSWGESAIMDKKVEENSSLGNAIKYLLKGWDRFTVFLRIPGIPMDNNELEGILRTQVLNRKNWLFYRSEIGSLIGDILTSVIKTSLAAQINPFDYLVWLQENKESIHEHPERYLPWLMNSPKLSP